MDFIQWQMKCRVWEGKARSSNNILSVVYLHKPTLLPCQQQ